MIRAKAVGPIKAGEMVILNKEAKKMETKPQFFQRKCKKCGHEGWMAKFCTVCGTQVVGPGDEISLKLIEKLAKDIRTGKIEVQTHSVSVGVEQKFEPIFDPWARPMDTGERTLTLKYRVVKK